MIESDHRAEAAREELLVLELQLMEPDFRQDRTRVEELLAPEFVEFGSSGRIWSREAILALLESQAHTTPEVTDFACRMLCADVALVTYQTVSADANSGERIEVVRSSIWRKGNAGWKICFHQGTRTNAARQAE